MTQTALRLLARAVAVSVAAVAMTGCEVNLNTEGLTAKETRSFQVKGQPDLTLETFDGAIEIHSWDRNEIEIEIEKRAMDKALIDQMKIEAEQEGDRIVLKVTGPTSMESRGVTIGVHISPSAKLLVAVPRSSLVRAHTDDGSIRVEDIAGRLTLNTDDGSVTADRVSGEVEIKSGDGAIRVQNAEGRLDLETDDGSITIDAKPTILRAQTADGAIRVQVADDAVMADNWDLQTRDGSVTLRLPAHFNAELDAETRDGSVRTTHPSIADERPDGENRERRRRELKTKVGDGGRLLKVRTGDGTIRIES
jgi:hypothetical protein